MKILLTGAGGYTGEGVAQSLMTEHWVRGLDIKSRDGLNDFVVGDLADLETCRRAMEGIEAVVFCHMAPRETGYASPPLAFDVNVKGTANLYHVMVEKSLRRAVLVSSTGVLLNDDGITAKPGDGPYRFKDGLYTITKVMQELVARYYFEEHGICSALLRPSWIIYDERLITKYGKKVRYYNPKAIDPRDIGLAAVKCLALPDLKLESFELGQADAAYQLQPTYQRLNWRPKHTFATLDWDPESTLARPSRLNPGTMIGGAKPGGA